MSKYISASNVYCFCSLVTSEKVKLSNIVDDNLPHYHKEGDQYYIVIVTKKARKKKKEVLTARFSVASPYERRLEGLSTLEIFW